MRADEEQNRHTLHGHFLIWIKDFDKVTAELFHSDMNIREQARMKLSKYVQNVFCSDYGYDETLPVIHEECQSCLPVSELFMECNDKQLLRNARHKVGSTETEGKILQCTMCNAEVSTQDVYNSVMSVSVFQL